MRLAGSDPNTLWFGYAVALDGDALVVGAPVWLRLGPLAPRTGLPLASAAC